MISFRAKEPDQDGDDNIMSSSSAAPTPSTASSSTPRVPRILACVLCQTRKIKCDRNSPCSNCIKTGITCVPSTPAPARKRRRPNQDLQQRLARCEELLSEYATGKPPDSSTEPAAPDEAWKRGKLIEDGGSVKFVESFLWANIHNELREMREILDEEGKEKEDGGYNDMTPTDTASPDPNTSMFLADTPTASLDDYYPTPAHVFLLWQTFLDRVNPLTKVIHVPTLQPLMVQAATQRENIPKTTASLLFAIFNTAAFSLREKESVDLLGMTREQAIARYSKGVRVAFMRIGILKTYDLSVLQALTLYMASMTSQYDRHASWILNGIVMRIAQKMGLHRDGSKLGLSVFDSEIRRRLWWQILLLDSMYALMSGLSQNVLPRHWDTKQPSNLNDSDLFPGMTSLQPREGPTDMICCLLNYSLARLLVDSSEFEAVILQNEMGVENLPSDADLAKARKRVEDLTVDLNSIIMKYGEPSLGPLHEFAAALIPSVCSKLHDVLTPPREQPEWGTEILTPQDNMFKLSVTSVEHGIIMYEGTRENGLYTWFVSIHVQIELVIYMVGQLSTRLSGSLVERAWAALTRSFEIGEGIYDFALRPNFAFGAHILRAWNKRSKALRELTGSDPEPPAFVVNLAQLMGVEDLSKASPLVDTPNIPLRPGVHKREQSIEQDKAVTAAWDNMAPQSLADLGSFDWDMFAMGQQQQQQQQQPWGMYDMLPGLNGISGQSGSGGNEGANHNWMQ